MRGYYGNPEVTSKTVTPDGWVRTGRKLRLLYIQLGVQNLAEWRIQHLGNG